MAATERSVELVRAAAIAADEKFGSDIVAYDVSERLAITDAFLLCTAANERVVRAVVEHVEDTLREQFGVKPVRREGEREGNWVLLDFVDIVVHVQLPEDRGFYALERVWKDCPQIELPEFGVHSEADLEAAGLQVSDDPLESFLR